MLGLIAIIVLAIARGLPRDRRRNLGFWALLAIVLDCAAGAFVITGWNDGVLVLSAGLLPLAAARVSRLRYDILAYTLFFAIVTVGGVIKYVNVWLPPSHLERVTLTFDGRRSRDGYLIMATPSFVYLAPRKEPCQVNGQISVFRRADIVEMRLRRRVDVWPAKHRLTAHDRRDCRDHDGDVK